jgi:hypothetical protein
MKFGMNYSNLRRLVMDIPEFRAGVLSSLSATSAATFSRMLMFPLTKIEKKWYLDLLRDFGEHAVRIREFMKDGCTITLVGKDVRKLVDRIEDPVGYWMNNRNTNPLNIWVAVVPKGRIGFDYRITSSGEALRTLTTFMPLETE